MKKLNILVMGAALALILAGMSFADQPPEKLYYGIEQDGKVCGYSEVTISKTGPEGADTVTIQEKIFVKLSAMGAAFDSKIDLFFKVDSKTGNYFQNEFGVEQGSVSLHSRVDIDGDIARISTEGDNEVKEVALPPDVLLENGQIFFHIIRDFIRDGKFEMRYRALDIMDASIHEKMYTDAGHDRLELAGKTYDAIVINMIDYTSGAKAKWWIDAADGYALKAILAARTIFLADSTIKDNIGIANLDDKLFAKVNVVISDIKSVSYMKAKVVLEPGGQWITKESLNFPGQAFEGTVEENLVDGIFEITHRRYDGANAPPFPPDFSGDETLRKYLEAEEIIESDDPVLIDKARELTDGAADSWDALKRISRWVDTEIAYDIPGGGTARKTYDMRLGECGAHSMLVAAFCRAVGIPCRVVWGCMYVPKYGGSFGQHAWNEVYMGEAGWIPIDATAQENDFVDCSHIRLGELARRSIYLNFKEAEILDYKAGAVSMADTATASVPDEYQPYIGDYQGPQVVLKVLVQNGYLAIDIPGKMVFELNQPDDKGLWVFKLTDAAGLEFQKDETGGVVGLAIVSQNKLPRKIETEPATVDTGVPEKYRSYLGQYSVPMQNIALTVIYQNDNLAVNDPNYGIIQMRGPDEENKWIDQFDQNKISFDFDEDGKTTAMVFHQYVKAPRIMP